MRLHAAAALALSVTYAAGITAPAALVPMRDILSVVEVAL